MAIKKSIKQVLTDLKAIRDSLPIGNIEALLESLQTNILDPIKEKLDTLAEKENLTEKQEERQSALEEERDEWEDICEELETFKDTLEEIESLVERIENIE